MTDSQTGLALRIKSLKLSDGQALLAMKENSLAENMTETALNLMVKKLRLKKVPFEPDEVGTYQWEEIVYRCEHLVELAVALKNACRWHGFPPCRLPAHKISKAFA